jgi:hypothetical protein
MKPKEKINCDSCGKPFIGEYFPMVNENFVVQKGLKQCTECYERHLLGKDYKKIKKIN